MKRSIRILMLVVVVGASFMAASCPIPWFFGTWGRSDMYMTEAITIGATALSIVGTGDFEGTLNATVNAHDETAGTVQATVTSATLWFDTLLAGDVMFWVFAANAAGQLFHLYKVNTDYPTGDPVSTGLGPYDSQ